MVGTVLMDVFFQNKTKGDKISAVLKAASYDVAPYWPGLFASALEGVKVADFVSQLGSAPAAGAAAPVAAAAAAPAAAAAAPAKKKEKTPEPSEDEDMGFGKLLFQ